MFLLTTSRNGGGYLKLAKVMAAHVLHGFTDIINGAIRSGRNILIRREMSAAALSLSEERLRTALSMLPMTVFHLDRDFRYTWIHNPLLPGAIIDDFIGRTGADFFDSRGYERQLRLLRHVIKTGETSREEITLIYLVTGEAHTYDHTVAPLRDRNGRTIGLTCAVIDITEKVNASEALVFAINRAQKADEAKSRFLAAASHDLRQPLQAMRLYLEALDGMLKRPRDRAVLSGAIAAQIAGEELLHNYLAVSRLEAGIARAEIDRVSITPLLLDLVNECLPMAQKKGISLRVHPPASHMVISDPRLLRQMLRNLIVNGIQFTERGGVLIGCRRRSNLLRIEIWDTGMGIAQEQTTAIFEDFYQVANPERDRAKGFGLGLSVVQRAALLLGHEVTLASRAGRGTVFALTVPLA